MNIIFIPQWLFGGTADILQCSDDLTRRQKLCKPQKKNSSKHVSIFLPGKYDVI